MIIPHNTLRRLTHQSDLDKSWVFDRKENEVWTDSYGDKWKKIGPQTRVDENPRKVAPAIPLFCPRCGKGIRQVDEPSIFAKGVCANCQFDEEIAIEWEEQKKGITKLNNKEE